MAFYGQNGMIFEQRYGTYFVISMFPAQDAVSYRRECGGRGGQHSAQAGAEIGGSQVPAPDGRRPRPLAAAPLAGVRRCGILLIAASVLRVPLLVCRRLPLRKKHRSTFDP